VRGCGFKQLLQVYDFIMCNSFERSLENNVLRSRFLCTTSLVDIIMKTNFMHTYRSPPYIVGIFAFLSGIGTFTACTVNTCKTDHNCQLGSAVVRRIIELSFIALSRAFDFDINAKKAFL
jgi:hypothetical protein